MSHVLSFSDLPLWVLKTSGGASFVAMMESKDLVAGDHRTALAAIREVRGAPELSARLTGALRNHLEVHQPGDEPRYVAVRGDGTPATPPPVEPHSGHGHGSNGEGCKKNNPANFPAGL